MTFDPKPNSRIWLCSVGTTDMSPFTPTLMHQGTRMLSVPNACRLSPPKIRSSTLIRPFPLLGSSPEWTKTIVTWKNDLNASTTFNQRWSKINEAMWSSRSATATAVAMEVSSSSLHWTAHLALIKMIDEDPYWPVLLAIWWWPPNHKAWGKFRTKRLRYFRTFSWMRDELLV